MIKNRKELKEYITYEKKNYIPKSKKDLIELYLTSDVKIKIWKYQKLLRKTEYFYNMKKNFYRNFFYIYYRSKKNKLGMKLGIEIWENSFDKGLIIYHQGSIVVNGKARIGKNCKLHGDNCIGNNGVNNKCPIIGDNVDVGVGAKIIGELTLANNIIIGAGAIVVNDFGEDGITICGVPAKKVNKNRG